MNKLRLLKSFQDLGESNETNCSTALTVFLDLLECQILVDYYFDADIQSIYFKQQLKDGRIDYIFPLTVNENIDLLRLYRTRKKFCHEDNLKGMVVAIVAANGTVIYERMRDGKVSNFQTQNS